MEKDVSKESFSDSKFLNRSVFVVSGEYSGHTTINELIRKIGTYSFVSIFIEGFVEYKYFDDYGFKEVRSEPVVIYDHSSGKVVSAIGALRVYCRYHKVESQSGFYFPGFRLSRTRRYRRIKTFSTKKAASYFCAEDGEISFKPKVRGIVSRRDGVMSEGPMNRNWKRFRKNQYKQKPA